VRRFFGNVNFEDKHVSFSDETLKHIRVVRLQMGETFEVVSQGKVFVCLVSNIYPFEAKVVKQKSDADSRELDFDLILLCPLLKHNNFELVLQKSVELGVKEIYPYISSRVIKRIDNREFLSKKERFDKIIKSASEQSNRTIIPILHSLFSLDSACELQADYKFIAYENEAMKNNLLPKVNIISGQKVICLIGPEGGFDSREVEMFTAHDFVPVSLGKRILRAETAALYMLSVIGYLGEKK